MDDLDAIDFQDLIQLDQQPPALIPAIPPPPPPVIKTPAQVVPAPVELSIHASWVPPVQAPALHQQGELIGWP